MPRRSMRETMLCTAPSPNHTKALTRNGTKLEPTTSTDSINKFILNIKTKIEKKQTNGRQSVKLCLMKLLLLIKEPKSKEKTIIFKSDEIA